ncbi:FAV1 [Candida oxycetoniae]|uniref:FAV1 n=1 Tax=Candida oxycetoniae TaxID=497107 RepID=A0AAI9T0K7_9ASCO|nr:FAV1 [Candida oxycetoniae]KAI3406643.2 FAV1 [Candida oxycetoniae]
MNLKHSYSNNTDKIVDEEEEEEEQEEEEEEQEQEEREEEEQEEEEQEQEEREEEEQEEEEQEEKETVQLQPLVLLKNSANSTTKKYTKLNTDRHSLARNSHTPIVTLRKPALKDSTALENFSFCLPNSNNRRLIKQRKISLSIDKRQVPRGQLRNKKQHSMLTSSGVVLSPVTESREDSVSQNGSFVTASTSTSKYKKINSPMTNDFFTHDLVSDCKFQYQQHIIEFLNYVIDKFKQLDNFIEVNGLLWNDSPERGLVLYNLIKINKGYKKMILSILTRLSKHSGIVVFSDSKQQEQPQENSEIDLISCNIFQFVYNCSIEEINIGNLVNTSLFSNEFKFNLLSYYYKLNFLLSKQVNDSKWLVIPMEIWYKLPSFIKQIKDHLSKLNRESCQDLEICLVKLNSITLKYPIIDDLKRSNGIAKWKDLNKIDALLEAKFPAYCDKSYKVFNKYYNQQLLADYENRPLSSSLDNGITHVKQVMSQKTAVAIPPSDSTQTLQPPNKPAAAAASSTILSPSSSKTASLKKSISKIITRSLSTNDAERNRLSNDPIKEVFSPSDESQNGKDTSIEVLPQRHQSLQEQHFRKEKQSIKTPEKEAFYTDLNERPLPKLPHASTQRPSQYYKDYYPQNQNQNQSQSQSQSHSRNSSITVQPIMKPTIERHRTVNSKSGSSHKHKKRVDNSQIQYQLNCLTQFRKKLFLIGPQLIEFLTLQLHYCEAWQRFLDDDYDDGDDNFNVDVNAVDDVGAVDDVNDVNDDDVVVVDDNDVDVESEGKEEETVMGKEKSKRKSGTQNEVEAKLENKQEGHQRHSNKKGKSTASIHSLENKSENNRNVFITRNIAHRTKVNEKNPYIKSIYQSFNEKLRHQIEFTKSTIILHIADRLIIPIDECLKLCQLGKGNLQNVNKFMELIVKQYNKLYCDWLEGMIGPKSIMEYQELCNRINALQHGNTSENGANISGKNRNSKKYGVRLGDDIIKYYDQLTKLKSLSA